MLTAPEAVPVESVQRAERPPALAVRIQQLETELRELRQQQRQEMLVAMANAVHGRVFSAGELLVHASVDTDLRRALADARTPRRVGRLLRGLAVDRTGPLRLIRVMRETTGCIWEIIYMSAVDATVGGNV